MRLGWKTITGALVWAIGTLTHPDIFATLPGNVAAVVSAIGVVLGAVGVRDAIAKGPTK